MVTIEIHNVKSQIMEPLDEDIIKEIRAELSAEMPGAFFARKYSPFAGVKYFFTPKTQQFPTGMIAIVRTILDAHKIQYQTIDCRPAFPKGKELKLHGVTLRDYQQEAVDLAVQKQRGILRCGTGGGKTSILSGIIARVNVPTIILIHKTDIFHQLVRNFERILKVPIGRIGDGECDIQNITVAMVQTLAHVYDSKVKVLEKDNKILKAKGDLIRQHLLTIGCVLVDESHHIAADTFWTVMQNIPNALYRVGVTATAFREDNMDIMLEGALAKKFTDISSSYLIDRGYLVQPTIYLFPWAHERRKEPKEPYSVVYAESIVENKDRNDAICLIAMKAKNAGKSILVAVTQIEHGEELEAMLQKVDPTAIFVNGQSDAKVRQQILKELGEGANRIVIATNIYSEGVDCPALEVLINAKAAASGIDSLQLLGRILRTAPGKTQAICVDFQDTGKFLTSHSKDRVEIYQTEPKYNLVPVTDISQIIF